MHISLQQRNFPLCIFCHWCPSCGPAFIVFISKYASNVPDSDSAFVVKCARVNRGLIHTCDSILTFEICMIEPSSISCLLNSIIALKCLQNGPTDLELSAHGQISMQK